MFPQQPSFNPRTATDGAPMGPAWSGARADGAGWVNHDTGRGFAPQAEGMAEAVRGKTASWRGTFRRARAAEGPRGIAVRWSVGLRYIGYMVTIIVCSAIGNAAFAGTAWHMAGSLMLFSAAVMTLTAALGCMFIPYKRTEIVEDFRHFLFQVSLLPATGLAVFQWVMIAYNQDPRNADGFLSLLGNSLPLLYGFTVFVPAVVFVKAVAGRRALDRSQQDDQELLQTWTRQDMFMR